ncbi:Phytoene desaturase (neurosporene-forming) [Rhodoplanes serenus]|uniref:Phytoene dehydrogenase n=1 Tax=Rhodoplanes serenus TaxID=200615 RepID=A0A3S4CEJ3_9BRAD|nr:Phytoene desaturase (neurosporene-forming) [Rhodoplanes serenus]
MSSLTLDRPRPPVVRPGARVPHAIVIGSGFGGLAAAIRLGARGYRVTVLEKLDQPGGRGSVFRQDGFTFDAGPTIVTLPQLFEELWALAGRKFSDDITLKQLDPLYQIRFDDGETFTESNGIEAMRREVGRLSPGDVEGYERFLEKSKAIYEVGFEKLSNVPFHSLTSMAKVLPDFVRLQSWRTVHGLAASYVKDSRIRTALSFHPLFIGGNPFAVTSIYCLITYLQNTFGVWFPMGGTGALVKGLAGLIEAQGNTIRYDAEVAAITVEGGAATGVRLVSGETIAADIVVSNADAAWTYRHLLPAEVRRRWTDRKLGKARYSMSLFVWYFGTKRQYRGVPHHSILLGPRYKELLRDIFDRKVLAPDFSLYLHHPTATDPSLAPPGCDAFYVLSPVPHLGSGVDWAHAAEPYRRAISDFLARTVLPGLEENVVSSRIITPLDFHTRYRSVLGAAFGFEPVFTQSAWFRPHNRSEEVDRLYLVGAGTHPGAGLPGVLSSARVLDSIVPHGADLA